MKNLTYNRIMIGDITISNAYINENVLKLDNYVLANFTTDGGRRYAINVNNKFAYPLI